MKFKSYFFYIRRKSNSEFEKIKIIASDSFEAVKMLPTCHSWDFVVNQSEQ